MDQSQKHSRRPDNALRCLWMDAGVVDFKLCDRFLQCDSCPFDSKIRQQAVETHEENAGVVRLSSDGGENYIEYFEKQVDQLLDSFNNLDLPGDRLYSANHTWVKGNKGKSTVGLDHCAARLLGPIGSVVLPQLPMRATVFSPCAWIVQLDCAIALQTPIAGEITSTNKSVTENPNLILNAPYTLGWMFSVKSEQNPGDNLFTAEKAQAVFHQQSGILRQELIHEFAKKPLRVGPTMMDGGRHLRSVQDILGARSYFNIVAQMLTSKPA